MFNRPINQLQHKLKRVFVPHFIYAHSKTCPAAQSPKICQGTGGSSDATSPVKKPDFKRAEKSAPCRFGFIPDDWFVFFHTKTGVTGPYIFGIVFCNYMLSKEKYILEHEYYSGLSIALICYLVVTRLGPAIGSALDKQVHDVQAGWEKGRQDQIDMHQNNIKQAKELQWRAEGQKILMDAKKECIAIQLEAAYRKRLMLVYDTVKGRLDYHLKKNRVERRIHQKWLVKWVLDQVHKSITPDLKKQLLERAIQELAAVGRQAK